MKALTDLMGKQFSNESGQSRPIRCRQRKSKLARFRQEILERRRDGKSFKQIQDWLFARHGVVVDQSTIWDFVKKTFNE
jgi:IS30 family transposase